MLSNNVEFVLVEVSELSMNDEVMQYEPKLPYHLLNKEKIMRAIANEPEDFWWPKVDGSVTMKELAELVANKNPSIGMHRGKWVEEGLALIGIILKKTAEMGFSTENAWNATFGDWSHFSAAYEGNLEELSKLYLISYQLGYMVMGLHDEEEIPLVGTVRSPCQDYGSNNSVGWLTLEK